MMYGFGDDAEPLPETVDLVEDIVVEYASALMHKAMDSASERGKLKGGPQRGAAVGPEEIMFLVRKVRTVLGGGGGGGRPARNYDPMVVGPRACGPLWLCPGRVRPPSCRVLHSLCTKNERVSPAPTPTTNAFATTQPMQEPKKYARVKELLIMSEELKDARRLVDVQAEALPSVQDVQAEDGKK